jgi:membrane-associated phospholipid phosphatase
MSVRFLNREGVGFGSRVGRAVPSRVGRALLSRLPKGGRDAFVQLALWGAADAMYELVRGIVAGQGSVALANAHSVISLEKATGTFVEPQIQALFTGSGVLMDAANWIYMNAQFTVNLVFLAFIYVYRNEIFYFVRNMFFVSMGIALIVHLAVPVAPPRMFPQYGFVDTVHKFAHVNQDSGAVSVFVNPYAAVPSMHMCFALLVGATGFRLTRRWLLRALAISYPLLVLAVIVITGNHFFFDAAVGAVLAVVAAIAAHRVMARLRPDAWAWRPVGSPAPVASVMARAKA